MQNLILIEKPEEFWVPYAEIPSAFQNDGNIVILKHPFPATGRRVGRGKWIIVGDDGTSYGLYHDRIGGSFEAAKQGVYTAPDGRKYRVGCGPNYYDNYRKRKPGLGAFRLHRIPCAHIGKPDLYMWIYIDPQGREHETRVNLKDSPVPPPLPRSSEERQQCHCHKSPHVCGSCGQPNWIEIHGAADGYCTYCYAAG